MTGTVLHSDNPDYPKGEEVVFAARTQRSFEKMSGSTTL
jgi:hypothetical protein